MKPPGAPKGAGSEVTHFRWVITAPQRNEKERLSFRRGQATSQKTKTNTKHKNSHTKNTEKNKYLK